MVINYYVEPMYLNNFTWSERGQKKESINGDREREMEALAMRVR